VENLGDLSKHLDGWVSSLDLILRQSASLDLACLCQLLLSERWFMTLPSHPNASADSHDSIVTEVTNL
jgi:hypothetical protein